VSTADRGEAEILARLRAGDEQAFRRLVIRHDQAMRRLARSFVPTAAVADEVVQETWLAVVQGLGRFEGRSSLRTWIFHILVNRAQTRGARERRTMPFSSIDLPESDNARTVDADRFVPAGQPAAGYWTRTPSHFFELPENRVLAEETRRVVAAAVSRLPARQQQVFGLRDIEGWEADEVCESLGLSAANQRVLLHRARAAVRAELEVYLEAKVA
jgi:RNA polymerase sigma-70 factor, ECF subfamily